jgi:DNA-binding transcriptional MerR regulator
MGENRSGEWTLTQAARLLREPQHRLIYLCEKGVVEPDLQDARGRGSSRLFSARNLLEFAVALRLRELEIPAAVVGAVIYVLRAFEQRVAAEIPGFQLPASLREPKAPDLRVVIADGRRLYFTLRAGKAPAKVFGGLDLRALGSSRKSSRALAREIDIVDALGDRRSEDFGGPERSRHARVEVSITRIAQDLRLQD